jgi:outer membrane cobalamin receptor
MRRLLLSFAALLSFLLFAQGQRVDTAHIYHLPGVTVTEKYQVKDVKYAVPTQSFNSTQLQRLNAFQLSDAVKHFAGVNIKDYGGIGGLKTISVRSLGAEHTAVSYDGISITDFQTGQIDIGRFSIENVDQISLSVGQNNSIFQPARLFASASVLNISTMTPQFKEKRTFKTSASFKTGSWGLINPNLKLAQKLSSRWALTATGEWMSSDGKYPFTLYYTNQTADMSSREHRNNTQVHNLHLESELFGNLKDDEQIRLKVYYYDSSRGLPGATTYYYNHSSQHLWDKNVFVQSHYQRELGQKWAVQASAKWNWSYQHYLDPDYKNTEGKTENSYYQQEYYLSTSVLYRMFDRLSFAFSSDESINRMNADLYDFSYPQRFTWLSALAAKYVDNHLTASASLLSTLTDEHVRQGVAGDNYRRLSPFVSVAYKPLGRHDLRFRFFYKDIFRLPTFNDLYYTSVGNTNLKPERTQQFNAGITYSKQQWGILSYLTASVDAYYNKVADKIIAIPTKNLFVWSMTNLGKVDMKGVDVSGAAAIEPVSGWQISLSGNYSYLKALDVTDSSGKTYKQQIAYTPRLSASLQCAVVSPWATLSYAFLHAGKRYILGQNIEANSLNGYSDSSVSLFKAFNIKGTVLSATAELLNLMNKNYEIVKNFPMPGRSFRIKIGVKL